MHNVIANLIKNNKRKKHSLIKTYLIEDAYENFNILKEELKNDSTLIERNYDGFEIKIVKDEKRIKYFKYELPKFYTRVAIIYNNFNKTIYEKPFKFWKKEDLINPTFKKVNDILFNEMINFKNNIFDLIKSINKESFVNNNKMKLYLNVRLIKIDFLKYPDGYEEYLFDNFVTIKETKIKIVNQKNLKRSQNIKRKKFNNRGRK